MNHWMQTYQGRSTSAEAAIATVQSGQQVFLSGNASVPQMLVKALVQRAAQLSDVQIVQVLTIGSADYVQPGLEEHIRVNTLFISDNVRAAVNEGRADYTPVFLSEISGLFSPGALPLDVALIHVSPPDEHGFCSFGVEVGISKPAAQAAKTVIAEVNDQMPRTLGDSFIHVSKITHLVPVSYPLPQVRFGEVSDLQRQIGAYVAELIEDGATLQMGIGGIPNGVLPYLTSKKDLGIHTELFSDGIVDLVEMGVINNERKTVHPGKIIAGFLLGTERLYKFVDNNAMVELHPTHYVNDPFLIAQNDKMTAVNSAIEVDITGQVVADSIGPRFYSGVGGQIDFVRGAARSRGGKPIIALPSTAKNDAISKIVTTLQPGAGVVTTRNDVHYVVTEFGVAYLHGKTIRQRVQALVNIAHPQFREALLHYARQQHYL